MELASRLIVIALGLWLICVSLFIFARPQMALNALRRFASTNLINYTELGLRLIAGLGLVGLAQYTDYAQILRISGGLPRGHSHYPHAHPAKMAPRLCRLLGR